MDTSTIPSPHRCRGTTKSGERCGLTSGLDANHFLCKFHAIQHVPADRQKYYYCLHIKSDGTRCKIAWDLDPNSGLCVHHNKVPTARPTQRPAPVTTASPIRPPHGTSLATSVIEGADTKTSSSSAPTMPTASPFSTETPSPPPKQLLKSANEWPPLWTVRYIVETRTVVIRMVSEWSWQCNHDPIFVIVPWWSKFDVRPVRYFISASIFAGNLLAKCLGGCSVVDSTRQATGADTVKPILKVLTEMNIDKGGLYESFKKGKPNDLNRLKSLLYHHDPALNPEESELLHVKPNNQDPIWILPKELHIPDEVLKRQPQPLTTATMQFEGVSGKGYNKPKQNGGIIIEWWLTKEMSDVLIEHGFACIKEPIPLTKLSRAELAHCVLRVKVHRREIGKEIGDGKIELARVHFMRDQKEDAVYDVDIKAKQQQRQVTVTKVHLCFLAESSKA